MISLAKLPKHNGALLNDGSDCECGEDYDEDCAECHTEVVFVSFHVAPLEIFEK